MRCLDGHVVPLVVEGGAEDDSLGFTGLFARHVHHLHEFRMIGERSMFGEATLRLELPVRTEQKGERMAATAITIDEGLCITSELLCVIAD